MKISQLSLVFLVAIILVTSCTKETTTSIYNSGPSDSAHYFNIYRNGSWVSFTAASGEITANPISASEQLTVEGTNDTSGFSINLQTFAGDNRSFYPRTYDTDSNSYQFGYRYDFYRTGIGYDNIDTGIVTHCHYVLTLTSITGTTISGTFTGNYLISYDGSMSMPVTQGMFSVKRAY